MDLCGNLDHNSTNARLFHCRKRHKTKTDADLQTVFPLPVDLIFKIKQPTQPNSSSFSCSSEPDAPATEDRRPCSDLQLSEVGWRAWLISTGRPLHIIPPSQRLHSTESQPLDWPAWVPSCALPLPLFLLVSPLHWPHLSSSPHFPFILSSPELLLLFFVLLWRHHSFFCSALSFFLLPLCEGGVQPPACRGRCDQPEAALSLRQLWVSSRAWPLSKILMY